jgi:hypothetical protein
MKVEALNIARQTEDPILKLNLLREYMHRVILRSWHEQGAFQAVSFVGGTALRLLFQLPRFSEDLDFSLVDRSAPYRPEFWHRKLLRELRLSGLEATGKWNANPTVQVGWVRIPNLLWEAGITDLKDQKLSIKIEVDTNPPPGAETRTKILSDPFFWAVRYHDRSSLMAGKITAVLARPDTKGRDWFDLFWFLSGGRPVEPNLALLQAGLAQTRRALAEKSHRWRELVRAQLETIDWASVVRDVQPLIERRADLDLFTRENVRLVLGESEEPGTADRH